MAARPVTERNGVSSGGLGPRPASARGTLASVLRRVLEAGPISRAELAESTGLSAAAVTRLSARLITAGIVEEVVGTAGTGAQGRPRRPIAVRPGSRVVLGMHIGATQIRLGQVDLRGTVLHQHTIPHPSADAGRALAQARAALQALIRKTRRSHDIVGVGASAGGWVHEGTIVEHPMLEWRDVPLRDILADRLGLPLTVDNAVRGLALAEVTFGAAPAEGSYAVVHAGNVLDAALVFHGKVHTGPESASGSIARLAAYGIGAGEHARSRLQDVAGDQSMLAAARGAGIIAEDGGLDELVAAARSHNVTADRLLRTRAEALGFVVATILDLINPDRVVLSGSVQDAPEYVPHLRAQAARLAHSDIDLDERVQVSRLGEHALLRGAVAPMLDSYLADPARFDPALATLH
jgi:predicted NBD/HSP70 family sugar kinase